MSALRRPRALRAPILSVLLVVALTSSGCQWLIVDASKPGTSTSPLQFVSPADRTQVAGGGDLQIRLRVGAAVERTSLQVELQTGPLLRERIDLDARVTFVGDEARATVGLDELQEGLSRITAVTDLSNGRRANANVVVSHEPRLAVADAGACEVLGQPRCALPFPSDRWTVPDATTDTGKRVAFAPATFPPNQSGTPFDPTEWNRNDGFSPGSALVAHLGDVDLAASRLPTIGTMSAYAAPDAGVMVVDAETGERWPVWAELDAWATSGGTRAIIIRPARNFLEGHRYVVGLRRLRDTAGKPIPLDREFRVLRDEVPTFVPAIEERRTALAPVFATLEAAGVARHSLNLAWDFTVASERNLSERILRVRDDAYAQLASTGGQPAFEVTSVRDSVTATIWRRVQGTIDVPKYLTGSGGPGSRLTKGGDGLPVRNGTWKANFTCEIPRSVFDGSGAVSPGRALVYGHGLLGGAGEVSGFGELFDTHRIVGCATDWIGMSAGDLTNVAVILGDLSKFPSLPDRLHQAHLNFQMLAKLMKDANGFSSHPAFRAGTADTPLIETGAVFYNGNSQGGILGAAATAISKEWTRAVLGVPGMNFSTLLTRSTHWDTFSPVLFAAYPDELTRTIGYSLIQMLWDRGEGNGYAHHLTHDPLPGTPVHDVLLIEAFGDHQVANVATESLARTAGMKLWTPALQPGRTDLEQPFFALDPVPTIPYAGSVLVVWDYGTPAPPQGNVPPRPPAYGSDPHGAGRNEPRVSQQVSDYLRIGGAFNDRCGGGPCTSP